MEAQHWRTARKGGCEQTPPHFGTVSSGSGPDGAIQAGDVVTAIGENLMYPVPTSIRLFLADKDTGAQYALPPRLPDGVGAVHGLPGHGHPRLGGQHRGEPLPHHGLVVDDQAADGDLVLRHAARPATGSTADTKNPPPGAGPADSEPPSSSTRSRMPVSPCPGP